MKALLIRHTYKGKFIRAYRLTRQRATVGSSKNAYIHLLGGNAAGLACLIQKEGSDWRILDLGSEPDTKIDHKSFVESTIDSRCTLTICENVLEIQVAEKYRNVFPQKYEGADSGANYYVAKWKGSVISSGYDKSEMMDLPKDFVQFQEFKMGKKKEVESEPVVVPEQYRKPLASTFGSIFVFLLIFVGIPNLSKKEPAKPADNVYTRMIFDSKVLNDKRKQLQSSGSRMLKGLGGDGQVQGAVKKQAAESKAVQSLRQAGISSIIGKIAKQASQNAALMARLAAMPVAEASVNGEQLNSFGKPGTAQGQAGKTDILNSNKGFKVGPIGTAGKGGGSGGYKQGNELGDGGVGHGDIAIDDSESKVEGGLDKEVIAKIIRENLGQIRYCYDRQLASDSELRGKVKVKFSIGLNGDVEAQSIGETTMKNAMVEECILRRIATWKFPKPRGGTKVLVSYPFLLKSVN